MKQVLSKKLFPATLCLILAVCLLTAVILFDKAERRERELIFYDSILTACSAFSLSPALVLAVIRTESDFHPDAISPAGAIGLMQLMPSTFSYLRDSFFNEKVSDDAIRDPTVNIRYGTCYLSYLLQKFGSLDLALAAYNAGEGRVALWLTDKTLSEDGRTLAKIPFPETEQYVLQTKRYFRHYLKKFHLKEYV